MAIKRVPENNEIGYCQLFKFDLHEKATEHGILIENKGSIEKGRGLELTVTFIKIAFSFFMTRNVFANVSPENIRNILNRAKDEFVEICL